MVLLGSLRRRTTSGISASATRAEKRAEPPQNAGTKLEPELHLNPFTLLKRRG